MVSNFLLFHTGRLVYSWFPQFKQAIIDDKYLVGHQLHNYGEANTGPIRRQQEPQQLHLIPEEVIE